MNRSEPTIDLAGVPIVLFGDHPVAQLVRDELAGVPAGEPRGYVEVRNGPLPAHDGATALGTASVSPHSIRFSYERSGITVEVVHPVHGTPFHATVAIHPRPMPYQLPKSAFRWLEPTFHRPMESQAYVFIHMVLESLLLASASTVVPLHAAAVERNGKALLLTSAGGVGKTSTAMSLVSSGRWNYLSDDIALLEPGEPVHPYRRLPMIYEYNLQANPTMRQSVRGFGGAAGRLQWSMTKLLHGPKRRRRISAAAIYGREVMAKPAPIECLAFLVRSEHAGLVLEPLATDEAVRRSMAVLYTEFDAVIHQLRLCEAAGAPELVEPAMTAAHRNYQNVFSEIPKLCEVRIPSSGASPAEVAAALEQHTIP